MKVKDLIAALANLPQENEVYCIWDGEPRTSVAFAYESKDGDIMLAGFGDVVYAERSRPKDAPTEKENRYWKLGNPDETATKKDTM